MSSHIQSSFDEAAEHLASILARATAVGRCTFALAGGHTPRPIYRRIAEEYGTRIDWANIHIFFGDERFVPATDPESNYRMARETLIDRMRIPTANVHRICTELTSPDAAAADYESQLRATFGVTLPRFDVMLLGLGADGHTASLFPNSPALAESRRWVVATTAPDEPRDRITLTLPVINNAAHILFVVRAKGKETALEHARAADADATLYPAAAVMPTHGEVHWFVDQT